MKSVRKRLSYGNVVATLALFLALTGGAALAASKITSSQIGKGQVKNKNLAKNAVKSKNLAKNAVNSAKLATGAVKNDDIADGSINFAKLAAGTNVIASATGGPIPADQDGPVPVPLNPPLTVTPVAGQPLTVSLEARGSLIEKGGDECNATTVPTVNNSPLLIGTLMSLESPSNPPDGPFPNGIPVAAISFPVGLTQPGVPQSIGLQLLGSDEDCAPGSVVNQVTVVVTQAK